MSQLSDALFTETQQKVLGLLYGQPNRSFYTKEILRQTGMGVATIKRELDRMLAAGILCMTRIGNQHHYQADPRCPIYGELLGIVKKTFGVTEVIRRALEPLAGKIDWAFIWLYPEFATHDHYLWSSHIVISDAFILYGISMECAQEYPHLPQSSKSGRRMDLMHGIRWLCS